MKTKYTLLFPILISGLLLLYTFFEWPLTDLLSLSFTVPIWLILVGSFILIGIFSLVQLFLYKNWLPLLICLMAGFVWLKAPLVDWYVSANYAFFKEERKEIARHVNTGKLVPSKDEVNISHLLIPSIPDTRVIHLPKKYRATTSRDGDVVVLKQKDEQYMITFFITRGILGGFKGYVYIPDNSTPKQIFRSKVIKARKLDKHWYFVMKK